MRKRPSLRRLSSLGRIFVALALLGALWFGTVKAVNDATDRGQAGRLADRLQLARILSAPISEWVAAAQRETAELAATVGVARGQGARAVIDRYLGTPRIFAKSALVLDTRSVVVGASADRAAGMGRPLTQCKIVGETGHDPTFNAVVAARTGFLSSVITVPGTCDRGVAVAVPAGEVTVVVLGVLSDLQARLDQVATLAAPLMVSALDNADAVLAPGKAMPGAVSAGLADLVDGHERAAAGRFFFADADADVVGAFQPTGAGWGVLVSQPAASFDVAPNQRPAVKVAALLTATFAGVFVLVTWFDVRRRRAARRADDDRSAFLAIVGHELRTPLTVIKGYTDTLAARWDALDERSRQMLVESMAPQTRRQAHVIEHLLTAASLQAGTGPRFALTPTALDSVVEGVVEEARALAPLHKFEADIPAASMVASDAAALRQALGELVDNAVRFSPSGGTVRISAVPGRRHVDVIVEDEGVGLPSDTARLFRPFSQVEDVDRRVHAEGGVGVGLFIARSLVEQMNGSVRAASRPEGGARFVVRLVAAQSTRPTLLERARP